jgi:tetratricopeptide (TPR) repeat protein
VQGNVHLSCSQNDESLKRIADTLNELVRENALSTHRTKELLDAINSILALRPQLDRIERNSAATNSISSSILSTLRKLEGNPEGSSSAIGEIDDLREAVQRRVAPMPKKIDPDDFVARISSISLQETGCPLSSYSGRSATDTRYKAIIGQGEDAMRRHLYKGAAKYFDAAVTIQPKEPSGYFKKAEALCLGRLHREALGVIEAAPKSIFALLDFQKARGQLLYRVADFRRAAQAFGVARKLDPRDASLAWAQGEALRRMGNCSAAVGSFSSAIRLDPRYTTAYLSRAECRIALDQPDLAIPDINTAIGLDETSPEPHRRLAAAYRMLAADRVLSRQADYRFFAAQEETKAERLKSAAERRMQADTPILNCRKAVCSSHVYYVYFEQDESFLTPLAGKQMQKLVEKAATCRRLTIHLKGFADINEGTQAARKELASSRINLISKVILGVLGRPGIMSVTMNYSEEFLIRTGADSGLISLIYSAGGAGDRPILAKLPDERNRVVHVTLKCEA